MTRKLGQFGETLTIADSEKLFRSSYRKPQPGQVNVADFADFEEDCPPQSPQEPRKQLALNLDTQDIRRRSYEHKR